MCIAISMDVWLCAVLTFDMASLMGKKKRDPQCTCSPSSKWSKVTQTQHSFCGVKSVLLVTWHKGWIADCEYSSTLRFMLEWAKAILRRGRCATVTQLHVIELDCVPNLLWLVTQWCLAVLRALHVALHCCIDRHALCHLGCLFLFL